MHLTRLSARDRDGVELTDEERAFFASLDKPQEGGYAHHQATRPDSLAIALTDSPAGLLSWIAENMPLAVRALDLSRIDLRS